MSTVRQFLQENLEAIGVVGAGQTMSSADASRSLSVLTNLVKSWNIQGLLVHAVTRETLTLTSSQVSRTIGATGQLVTARPTRILEAAIKDSNVEYPMTIINHTQWSEIPDKTVTGMPIYLYIEGTYPNDTLHFYPIPDENYSFILQSQKPIISTLTLETSLSMPDGYEYALGLDFQCSIPKFFGKAVNPDTRDERDRAKANLMIQNQKEVFMNSDLVGHSRPYNILVGE